MRTSCDLPPTNLRNEYGTVAGKFSLIFFVGCIGDWLVVVLAGRRSGRFAWNSLVDFEAVGECASGLLFNLSRNRTTPESWEWGC